VVGTGLEFYAKVRQISEPGGYLFRELLEGEEGRIQRIRSQARARPNLLLSVLSQPTWTARQIVDHPEEWEEGLRNGKICWGMEDEQPSRAWVNYWYCRYNRHYREDPRAWLMSVGFVFWDQDGLCTPSWPHVLSRRH
jgi:hypothetical protein